MKNTFKSLNYSLAVILVLLIPLIGCGKLKWAYSTKPNYQWSSDTHVGTYFAKPEIKPETKAFFYGSIVSTNVPLQMKSYAYASIGDLWHGDFLVATIKQAEALKRGEGVFFPGNALLDIPVGQTVSFVLTENNQGGTTNLCELDKKLLASPIKIELNFEGPVSNAVYIMCPILSERAIGK